MLALKRTWQESTEELKACDVIMGAVDSMVARDQIEAFCRRFLIPYIDVGMDVVTLGKGAFLISGQVIASMPGEPCMRCCGFVTDEKLQEEAKLYGDAGGRPQVVWPNGVLASTAIGLMVQTFTPWHRRGTGFAHLVYDGNRVSKSHPLERDTLMPLTALAVSKAQVRDKAYKLNDDQFDQMRSSGKVLKGAFGRR